MVGIQGKESSCFVGLVDSSKQMFSPISANHLLKHQRDCQRTSLQVSKEDQVTFEYICRIKAKVNLGYSLSILFSE